MNARLEGLGLAAALVLSSPGIAAGPSSPSFAIAASVLGAGVGPAASAGYDLAGSLGAPALTAAAGGASAHLHAGFQAAAYRLNAACLLDVDGNGSIDALTDGLLVLRALFGLTGAPVTAGAVAPGAARATWTAIRAHLNANCGTNLTP